MTRSGSRFLRIAHSETDTNGSTGADGHKLQDAVCNIASHLEKAFQLGFGSRTTSLMTFSARMSATDHWCGVPRTRSNIP